MEHLDKKRKILIAATTIAIGARALRSWKLEGEGLTFDVSVWGDKTKSVFADIIDDSKKLTGRLAGWPIFGPDNKILDVEIPEDSPEMSIDSLEALDAALADTKGWSGQQDENTLQNP